MVRGGFKICIEFEERSTNYIALHPHTIYLWSIHIHIPRALSLLCVPVVTILIVTESNGCLIRVFRVGITRSTSEYDLDERWSHAIRHFTTSTHVSSVPGQSPIPEYRLNKTQYTRSLLEIKSRVGQNCWWQYVWWFPCSKYLTHTIHTGIRVFGQP
jgi:hypothetical protein